MSEIILTEQQRAAAEAAVEAIKSRKPLFRIGGYAGTGKTTIAKTIVEAVPGAAVCAFTGKAASVLRRKGLSASTIHSTIYTQKDGHFVKRSFISGSYFLIDEGSMVSRGLWEDVQSFRLPIVVIGDPGQLEPVGDDPRLMESPDVVLEQIHRQAENSTIIEFANKVRHGGAFRHGEKGDVLIGGESLFWDSIGWADQLLCGFNKTRVAANSRVRAAKGFSSTLEEGERIICLQNDANLGVFNGMMLIVQRIKGKDRASIVADCTTEDGEQRPGLKIFTGHFGRETPMPRTAMRAFKGLVIADYGYCTTVHKYQGSEEQKVAILDEQCSKWEPRRWRYTAITRAAERLRYCI